MDETALILASRYGYLDVVISLIQYGANIAADNVSDEALRQNVTSCMLIQAAALSWNGHVHVFVKLVGCMAHIEKRNDVRDLVHPAIWMLSISICLL